MKTKNPNKRERKKPRYKSHEVLFNYYCTVERNGTRHTIQDVADYFEMPFRAVEDISFKKQWEKTRKERWNRIDEETLQRTIEDKSYLDKELLNFWLDAYKLVRERLTYIMQMQMNALKEPNLKKRKKMLVSGYELEALIKSFKETNGMIRLNIGKPTDYTKSDQTTRNITELLEDDLSRIDSYIKEINGRIDKENDKLPNNTATNTGNN